MPTQDNSNMEEWFDNRVEHLVATWWDMQVKMPWTKLYLYYKPGKIEIGPLNAPGMADFTMIKTRIPNFTRDSARYFIRKQLRGVNCLPVDKNGNIMQGEIN